MGILLPTESSGEERNRVFDAPGTGQGCVGSNPNRVISNDSHTKGCLTQIKAPLWGEQLQLNPAYKSLIRVTLKGSSSPTRSPHHPTHGAVVLTWI